MWCRDHQWAAGRPLTCSPHLCPQHTHIRTSGTALRGQPGAPSQGHGTLVTHLSVRCKGHWGSWRCCQGRMVGVTFHLGFPLAASGPQGLTGVTSPGKPPGPSPPEARPQTGAHSSVPSGPSVTQGPHPLVRPREGWAEDPGRGAAMSPDQSLVLQEGGPPSETLGPQPKPFLTGNPGPRACPESPLLICKRLASPPSGQRP